MNDQAKWDARYRAICGQALREPDAFVLAGLERIGPGAGRRAVDLAGGRGRHVGALLERGWCVELIDVSPVGLAAARELWGRPEQLTTRALDLLAVEGCRRALEQIEPADLLLVVDFLERELWAALADLARPGGHVLAVTFTTDRPGERPPSRFCLQPGEISLGLPGLETLALFESAGRAGLLGRRLPGHRG